MTNELLKLVANSPAGVTAVGSGDWLGSNNVKSKILWQLGKTLTLRQG
jgi:hypothetical protein